MESLENKLNRVDAAVSTIKQNLHFEENALIEDVAASTDIKRLTNVFVQQNEPSVKDGIWVQCDEKENAFDKIIMDRDMIIPYKWQALHKVNVGVSIVGPALSAVKDGKVYFRLNPYSRMYDLVQNTGQTVAIGSSMGAITPTKEDAVDISDTHFYWFPTGYGNPYSWNLETNAREDLPHVGYGIRGGCYDAVTDTTYIIHNYGTRIQKLLPGGWNTIYSGTKNFVRLTSIGGRLLAFAEEEGYSIMIDLNNNNAVTPIEGHADAQTAVCKADDVIYLYNTSLTSVYKYNIDTLEREDVTALFQDPDITSISTMFYSNGIFYALVGGNIIPMDTKGKEYDSSAVLISQAPITRTEHQTALWTYDGLEGRMTQSFYDIFYYNKEKGVMKGYPIYYGNGTEWIKFKN